MILDLKMAIVGLAAQARLIRKKERANNRKLQKVRDRIRLEAIVEDGERGPGISDAIAEAFPPELVKFQSVLLSRRCGHIRHTSRHHHLAYGFLRGKPYYTMERTTKTKPFMDQIADVAVHYGRTRIDQKEPVEFQVIAQHFEEWAQAARAHLAAQFPDPDAEEASP